MYLAECGDLIGWQRAPTRPAAVRPWKPKPLNIEQWPPDYAGVFAWRIETLEKLRANPDDLISAKAYYRERPVEFILHWMDTYDPRIKKGSKWVPFVFFEKQAEFIQFLHELRSTGENGLCEKSRDMGISWGGVGYSVWSWIFLQDDAIGWGSRKQELVDKIGDLSSLFEKIRAAIRRLPDVFKPSGLVPKQHLTFMKCINPENGSSIIGETGDNIGRGGRTAMYFKDESAHYEHAEKVEAALGDNTNTQVDISSVNGLGNVFHRRRQAGVNWSPGAVIDPGYVRVFVMDWRDHPEKTQNWYDVRKARYEREGMLHLFAQEVDRNYSAAISNTIIPYEWIVASVDAHLKIPYLQAMGQPANIWSGGLDVADEGIDRNAFALRQWIVVRDVQEWGERDVGVTTRRALTGAQEHRGIKIQYDAIGVGSGVKSEYNRLRDEFIADGTIDKLPVLVPWNAGARVLNPYENIIPGDYESLTNFDMFGNLKAQAWWSIRTRFYKTFKAVTAGVVYPADELISLDSSMVLLQQLMQELSQPTRGSNGQLKTIVNKQPDGMKSPNLADAVIMVMFPVPDDFNTIIVGGYQ